MKLNVLIPELKDQQNIAGVKNNNLKVMEEIFECEIVMRGDEIYTTVSDEKIALLEEIFDLLKEVSHYDYVITERDIIYICNANV